MAGVNVIMPVIQQRGRIGRRVTYDRFQDSSMLLEVHWTPTVTTFVINKIAVGKTDGYRVQVLILLEVFFSFLSCICLFVCLFVYLFIYFVMIHFVAFFKNSPSKTNRTVEVFAHDNALEPYLDIKDSTHARAHTNPAR